MSAPRVAFVVHQILGHKTHYGLLQEQASRDATIQPVWIPLITGPASRIPFMGTTSLSAMSARVRHLVLREHRREPLDALYLYTYEFAIGNGALMREIPTVVGLDATVDNQRHLDAGLPRPWSIRRLAHPIRDNLLSKALRHAARVIPVSEWAARSVIDFHHVADTRVKVIPFGVDLEFWRRPLSVKALDGPMRILFVGGECRRKGLDHLVRACESLPPDLWTLDVVTNDNDAPGIVGSSGRIHSHIQARSAELKQILHNSDVLALPTRRDCSPWVLMEAMAAGLAVVTCSVGAIPEMLTNGRDGLIIDVNDDKGLASSLFQLATQPQLRQGLSKAARRRAEISFDSRQNYGHLFEEIRGVSSRRA